MEEQKALLTVEPSLHPTVGEPSAMAASLGCPVNQRVGYLCQAPSHFRTVNSLPCSSHQSRAFGLWFLSNSSPVPPPASLGVLVHSRAPVSARPSGLQRDGAPQGSHG